MVRRSFALLTAVAFVGTAMAETPAEKAQAPDAKALVGEWKLEKAVRDGEDAPPQFIEAIKVRIEEKKMVIVEPGGKEEAAEMTLSAGKTPAEIDLKPLKEDKKTVKGIYKLDGDTLTLCWTREGGDRPTAFESKKDTMSMLMVLKREKK